ncbi:helix-turn-helix domain-containing protein, partial [Bacillus cereus]
MMNTAYKFRIYPNQVQAILINKTIGCSRFV